MFTMYGVIDSLICFIWNTLIEFIVYVLIDVLAKTSLREARDDGEKRVIWLYESVVLMVAALLVYLFHHSPVVLILLASCTFVYTQLLGRINFRYWWWQLATRWDEFQQHEESMEHYNEMQNRRSAVQFTANQMAVQTNWVSPSVTIPYGQIAYDQTSNEPWYPVESAPNIQPITSQAVTTSAQFPATPPQVRQGFVPPTPPEFHGPQPIYSSSPIMAQRPQLVARPELVRRPLHTFMPSPVPKVQSVSHSPRFSNIKNRFLSVLGINEGSPHPPGLPNKGQNICFLNAVLQCVSHTPKLSMRLNRDCKVLKNFITDAGLVLATNELMQKMVTPFNDNSPKILDHLSFRELASQVRGSVIVNPRRNEQQQQDAAEVLMWLLDVLHRSLNMKAANRNSNNDVPSTYQNVALDTLKYIYGDLSTQRVVALKESCKKEIAAAHSLDVEAYAEPIQRLSDLEWLTYKESNSSVIDDLFIGQQIEAQRCIECNKISVNIQTFSVLPVPIVEPRQLNGLVYLEDCFTKFGTTEDLVGPNGLRCECSMNALGTGKMFTPVRGGHQQWGSPLMAGTRQQQQDGFNNNNNTIGASPSLANGGALTRLHGGLHRRKQALRSDSVLTASPVQASAAMSPISGAMEEANDSGFHDNQLRTSTPIHAAPQSPLAKLTDGQRRSLLRQLPDCLVIQLMRFTHQNLEMSKLHKPVSIPLQGLDLTHLVIDRVLHGENLASNSIPSYKYDLYGVCVHLGGGNMACGHYVAYSKHLDGVWYKFDDETVTPVNMEYELTTKNVRENAYILFYRKTGTA